MCQKQECRPLADTQRDTGQVRSRGFVDKSPRPDLPVIDEGAQCETFKANLEHVRRPVLHRPAGSTASCPTNAEFFNRCRPEKPTV